MTNNQDRVITSMEITGEMIDIGKEEAKKLEPSRRYRYKVPVKFTVDETLSHDSFVSAMTKPKLETEIENDKRNISQGRMKLTRTYDDRTWMVITTYTISLC